MADGWQGVLGRIARAAVREAPRVLREVQRARGGSAGGTRRSGATAAPRRPSRTAGHGAVTASAGTAGARPAGAGPSRTQTSPPAGRHLEYAPQPDGQADPGEVVWTWVTYEEDAAQGKDRPVLVVGRDGRELLGLMLSSQASRDGQQGWLALGPGTWDREARPSWVRLDRVLHVDEDGIRREGAVLDRARFDRVASVLRDQYAWR